MTPITKSFNLTIPENSDIENSKASINVEIIEYIPNSAVIKTIIKKTRGNVSVESFDSGDALTDNISEFDTFIQIIDGKAEIKIDAVSRVLESGESIVIPAKAHNTINANAKFKMISTTINP